jgi:hypothetical protein
MDISSDKAKELIQQGADPKLLARLVIPPLPEGAELGFMVVSPQEFRGCCKKLVETLIPIIKQYVEKEPVQ